VTVTIGSDGRTAAMVSNQVEWLTKEVGRKAHIL